MKRVLIVRAGSPGPGVLARHGDFTDWFDALLAPEAQVSFAEATPAHALPIPGEHDGVVVTGSFASVAAPEPWMDDLGRWLVAVSRSAAVLGVCFGHQLLAHALGGRVEQNLRGPEAGTHEVELTAEGRRDPLFRGLPHRIPVQQSHSDHVTLLPAGAVVLARNGFSPVQAFAHGPRIRGVQFHPEFDVVRCRDLCEEEAADLDGARAGLAAEALASIQETPDATAVLHNWVRELVV